MKRIAKYLGIGLLAVAVICIVGAHVPTLGKQVPFNQWFWKHDHWPFERVRYYMSESLVEKLRAEKPSIEETVELLGNEDYFGIRYEPGDTRLYYFLMTPPFLIMGLDMYSLIIDFNDDGSFRGASVIFED